VLFLLLITFVTIKMTFYPSLNNVTVNQVEKVSEITSPDNSYKLHIYFHGGVLLKWDYSYIGELENVKTSEKRNILWLPPETPEIQWLDNDTLLVGDEKVRVDKDTYDAR
ncbi:MAG: DUF5412 family protein, partial [Lysinibacillus sp.]